MADILPAAQIGTFDTSPKRKRGIVFRPSLALRASVKTGCERYNFPISGQSS